MTNHRQLNHLRSAVLAALVVLSCATAACGVGPATDKDKIAETTSTYLRALAHGQTASACRQLSPRAQGDSCPQAVEQQVSLLQHDALEKAADASLAITVHRATATSRLGKPAGARLTLVKIRGSWRIDSGFAVPAAASRRHDAPPIVGDGAMVDIGGGRSLYLKCIGSGRPTVVLEAGFGGSSADWDDVQRRPGLATRTCAYDRAGLGNSVAIPRVHDAAEENRDLQRLLAAAHIPPPYVLVGHSYGGLLVRLFAHAHPDQVAGVVLVDAMGRDQTRRQLAIWPRTTFPAVRRELARRIRDGVDLAAGEALDSHVKGLGATPLAVVTAGRHDAEWGPAPRRLRRGLDRLWTTMQDELAGLASDHLHVVARHSDHFVQRLDGQPVVVTRAITAVVRATRHHTQLPRCPHLFSGAGIRCR
jgi:pimeloyl-ACP methyl ester carboxylesterase